jgi:hypothetical protein
MALALAAFAVGTHATDMMAGPGCKNVGKKCKNAGQCCSGVCKGKKGKKRCKAHDTGKCPPGLTETACGADEEQGCTTSTGLQGVCDTTTGNAGYCLVSGDCFPCAKDADCRPFCGPTAACVQCADCVDAGNTVCGTAGPDPCEFPL